MNWSTYVSFLGLATLLVLVPGADFAVVTRNALVGGRRRGWWSAVGVTTSNLVQGAAAAAGLAAVIVRIEPLFEAIRWSGIAYLAWLAVQSLRSAFRGVGVGGEAGGPGAAAAPGQAFTGWRQGFLSSITNPKVLVFYLAVLPAFLGADAPVWALLLFASTHAAVGLVYLFALVTGVHRARRWLARRRVRRSLDAATGVALLGFSARLALD